MQIFKKTNGSNSTTGAIETVKAAIQQQQVNLEKLLAQQAELSLSITECQQQLEVFSQQLTHLEIQQVEEEREAELELDLRELRPLADRVNELRQQLIDALTRYEKRVEVLKQKPQFAHKFETERSIINFVLPEIKHQLGSSHFNLNAQYKQAQK